MKPATPVRAAEKLKGEEYQLDRLVEAVMENSRRPIDEILDRVERDLEQFVRGVPYVDDRTMVMIRRLPAD